MSTTSSTSFNLFSNFTSTSSTTEDVASYSTGTSLFVTSTSGLSFQVNPSVLQSTPSSFSIANSTVPASTVASFPSSLKTTTTTTLAKNFATIFTGCVEKVKGIKKSTFICNTDPGDLSVKFAPKPGSWECNDCLICNKRHVTQCVACGSVNPNSTVTSAASVDSLSLQGLGTTFPTLSGSATFGSFKLGSTMLSVVNQPASMPPVETIQSSTITAVDNGESEHSSYEDEEETEEEEDEEGSDVDIDHKVVVSSQTTTSILAAKFACKPSDWECNFCFVSNEKDIAQCIACGNINPNITTAPISSTATNVSFTSGVKLPVSLPAGQASQPVSTAVGFSLGGIKLGSLNNDTSTASSSGSIFNYSAGTHKRLWRCAKLI